jgi:hypothetical protein
VKVKKTEFENRSNLHRLSKKLIVPACASGEKSAMECVSKPKKEHHPKRSAMSTVEDERNEVNGNVAWKDARAYP